MRIFNRFLLRQPHSLALRVRSLSLAAGCAAPRASPAASLRPSLGLRSCRFRMLSAAGGKKSHAQGCRLGLLSFFPPRLWCSSLTVLRRGSLRRPLRVRRLAPLVGGALKPSYLGLGIRASRRPLSVSGRLGRSVAWCSGRVSGATPTRQPPAGTSRRRHPPCMGVGSAWSRGCVPCRAPCAPRLRSPFAPRLRARPTPLVGGVGRGARSASNWSAPRVRGGLPPSPPPRPPRGASVSLNRREGYRPRSKKSPASFCNFLEALCNGLFFVRCRRSFRSAFHFFSSF